MRLELVAIADNRQSQIKYLQNDRLNLQQDLDQTRFEVLFILKLSVGARA
jgi:hypothetical protein